MKKVLLIMSLMSVLFLAGCSNDKKIDNLNIPENTINQQQENLTDQTSTEIAGQSILNILEDEQWIRENVYMKKTCFGEEFTGNQELTYEILRDDLALVQAFSYDDNGFGVQIFLIGYKDGKVQVISCPEDEPAHPGHGGFGVDKDNLILVNYWMHQGSLKYTAYKIDNLSLTEIDSITFDSDDEYNQELLDDFNKKYVTHPLSHKFANEEIITEIRKQENITIPQINISSDDAKRVNEELKQKIEGDIVGYEASYKYNISENILSLLIENISTVTDNYTWYDVYNFDINTGKLLSTSDVLGHEKASKLMEKLSEICSEEFYRYWADTITDRNGEGPKFYHEENQKLIANSIDEVPCYIDGEKGQQIIIKIASFAGPSYYEHIVNLSDYIE